MSLSLRNRWESEKSKQKRWKPAAFPFHTIQSFKGIPGAWWGKLHPLRVISACNMPHYDTNNVLFHWLHPMLHMQKSMLGKGQIAASQYAHTLRANWGEIQTIAIYRGYTVNLPCHWMPTFFIKSLYMISLWICRKKIAWDNFRCTKSIYVL